MRLRQAQRADCTRKVEFIRNRKEEFEASENSNSPSITISSC
jgi:hypothetical protein